MEYFYQDALRWSFGFENPNKAAVLWACALPLAWAAWVAVTRGRGSGWLRVLGGVVATGLVLGAAFCLFKTYSRGGAVAAAVGVGYVVARCAGAAMSGGPRGQWRWFAADAVLLAGGLALFVGTGLAARSAAPLAEAGDASVENRLVLWRAALQMAADHPAGFGAGTSGAAYMNWYQPVEMTAGYRTMVNSYLTALVEWGWPVFGLVALAAGFFWSWANPGGRSAAGATWAWGMRGAVLAFAVAGVFSTTMEDGRLWILPVLCVGLLAVGAARDGRSWRAGWPGMAAVAAGCLALVVAGSIFAARDAEWRKFAGCGVTAEVLIGPRGAGDATWEVIPDAVVLGEIPGRLLRSLAAALGERLRVGGPKNPTGRRVILAGEAVRSVELPPGSDIILLAPASVPEEAARRLLGKAQRVRIFVPEIDEDGRSEFWTEVSSASPGPEIEVVVVEGVGTRLDWSWSQVLERVAAPAAGGDRRRP